jgi:16S rRNA (guanine527-N7)-methyltransferase
VTTGDAATRIARTPPIPAAAEAVFGARLPLATRFRDRLAGDAVVRGLIGPRERDRLWERHLLNSAILTDLLPVGVRVVDVGSGAGLPGIPMAIRRPDLQLDLVEPMQRRTEFLCDIVDELGLSASVRVVRGRADDPAVVRQVGSADWVVARAVAPLDRLVRWCLPLLSAHGRLLALKGAAAAKEAAEHEPALRKSGTRVAAVVQLGEGLLRERTWVVTVERCGRGGSGER